MAVTKKGSMQSSVFSGISAIYACAGGFVTSAGSYVAGENAHTNGNKIDLSNATLIELPVSEDSGFSLQGGEATINHFKVKGLNSDWASTFTPGDGSITLEVPTYHTSVLELVYGQTASWLDVNLPNDLAISGDTTVAGKAFSFEQKAVVLGLIILDETATKALFIKKAKFLATPSFDGSDKPFCVTLTGTISATAEKDSICVLEKNDEFNQAPSA